MINYRGRLALRRRAFAQVFGATGYTGTLGSFSAVPPMGSRILLPETNAVHPSLYSHPYAPCAGGVGSGMKFGPAEARFEEILRARTEEHRRQLLESNAVSSALGAKNGSLWMPSPSTMTSASQTNGLKDQHMNFLTSGKTFAWNLASALAAARGAEAAENLYRINGGSQVGVARPVPAYPANVQYIGNVVPASSPLTDTAVTSPQNHKYAHTNVTICPVAKPSSSVVYKRRSSIGDLSPRSVGDISPRSLTPNDEETKDSKKELSANEKIELSKRNYSVDSFDSQDDTFPRFLSRQSPSDQKNYKDISSNENQNSSDTANMEHSLHMVASNTVKSSEIAVTSSRKSLSENKMAKSSFHPYSIAKPTPTTMPMSARSSTVVPAVSVPPIYQDVVASGSFWSLPQKTMLSMSGIAPLLIPGLTQEMAAAAAMYSARASDMQRMYAASVLSPFGFPHPVTGATMLPSSAYTHAKSD